MSGFPQSIALRCRLTPSFAEFRQMLLVDAIDPGLHVRHFIRTESSPTNRPERNHSNRISSAGRLAKASASAVNASLSGLVTPRPPKDILGPVSCRAGELHTKAAQYWRTADTRVRSGLAMLG